MFCLYCGGPIAVACRFEDDDFTVKCPPCSQGRDEFSREEVAAYKRALFAWFIEQKDRYWASVEKAPDAR